MAPLLPLPMTLWVVIAASLTSVVLLRVLHPVWWRSLALRIVLGTAVLAMTIGMILWRTGTPSLAHGGVALTWKLLMVFLAVTVALVPAGIVRMSLGGVSWLLDRWHKGDSGRTAEEHGVTTRRAMLQGAVATVPALAFGGGIGGLCSANDPPRIVRVPMQFANLPPDLQGLKILHLSDLHLGYNTHVSDVAALMDRVRPLSPDLVAVTGDVADHLDQLGPCLEVLAGLGARLGVFVSLGNHEYLAGIEDVLPIIRTSRARLLVSRSTTLTVGRARLLLAGADDQPHLDDVGPVLERSIARVSAQGPQGAFRLLLCHRPDGFPIAARHGFDLALLGHTHGGQVGALGRSARELLPGHRYLWGKFGLGTSQLYTTSGVGEWFPFRLGCPREAALVVVESSLP